MLSKTPYKNVGRWYARVFEYLINHPSVVYDGERGNGLYFHYDFYRDEKTGFAKIGINELIHIDVEKKTVGMHSPFWPANQYIAQLLEDSRRKHRVKFTSTDGQPGSGFLEVKVNRLYPRSVQRLFDSVTRVYDIKKQLEKGK